VLSDGVRRVLRLAQKEARVFRHSHIGTEHILLGLMHDGEGLAAKALGSLGISLESVYDELEKTIGLGDNTPAGSLPFTLRAKKVIELSAREAHKLGHNSFGLSTCC
jgi:ATP-dependent Clp protease ATP-binding subunit ClpC